MQKSATNYFFFDNVTFPTLHFYLPFTHYHLISTLFQTQANVMCVFVFVCVHSLIHAMCVCVPRFPPPLPKNKRPDNYSSTTTYYVLHQKKKVPHHHNHTTLDAAPHYRIFSTAPTSEYEHIIYYY